MTSALDKEINDILERQPHRKQLSRTLPLGGSKDSSSTVSTACADTVDPDIWGWTYLKEAQCEGIEALAKALTEFRNLVSTMGKHITTVALAAKEGKLEERDMNLIRSQEKEISRSMLECAKQLAQVQTRAEIASSWVGILEPSKAGGDR
ncbi:hypothetical protein CC2G_014859 [Coprinopsis cinerea AmutBmut pab1-1]|nr:hypothetical protein CC2G_014859 [Coprinopsis cinerea AmutBmut pab1-1]